MNCGNLSGTSASSLFPLKALFNIINSCGDNVAAARDEMPCTDFKSDVLQCQATPANLELAACLFWQTEM